MSTISVAYGDETVAGFAAVAVHMAKKTDSPVVAGVQVSGTHFLATDRYSLARFEYPATGGAGGASGASGADDGKVFVPFDVAVWLGKQTVKAVFGAAVDTSDVRIVFTDDSVSITGTDASKAVVSRSFEPVRGNLPPVERLFEPDTYGTPEPAASVSVRLNAGFVERFTKSAKLLTVGKSAPTVDMVVPAPGVSGKPPVVRFSVGDRFEGLLQSNREVGGGN